MTTIHCCINVRWLLGHPNYTLKKLFLKEDGTRLSAKEAREYLYDCLTEGKEVLPFGEPCEGFDYKTGCPGHETDKSEWKNKDNNNLSHISESDRQSEGENRARD